MRIRAYAVAVATVAALTLAACGSTVAGTASPAGPALNTNTSVSTTGGDLPTTDAGLPTTADLPTTEDGQDTTPDETTPDITEESIPDITTELSIPDFPTDESFPSMPSGIEMPSETCLTVATAIAPLSTMTAPDKDALAKAVAAAPEIASELEVIGKGLAGLDLTDPSSALSLGQNPELLNALTKVSSWLQTNCAGGTGG